MTHSRGISIQVPKIYKEMESAGCTGDRKAREILQNASIIYEQHGGEYLHTSPRQFMT